MDHAFLNSLYRRNKDCALCPSKKRTAAFLENLIALLFPDFEKKQYADFDDFQSHIIVLKDDLREILSRDPAWHHRDSEGAAEAFFTEIPRVYTRIREDVEAMYSGDPAARSHSEVVRCYPGFYAIAAYRIAHELLKQGADLIPRIFTEAAHNVTGIDIHPGAVIGRHFCIDHGTGVVIGETSHIGEHVKIYQGVTLGGLSVDKADARKKRHPTIEDHVVIYAGATILGGGTVVGARSIIGGNVWLTRSVAPDTKVYYKAAMTDKDGATDIIEFKQ
ncbi:MAG: serine O-acetyltransferase EpsC [Cryomorphaceae bacterium]|nr:serine acetyltransferase [Flavobacteriales bacterium]